MVVHNSYDKNDSIYYCYSSKNIVTLPGPRPESFQSRDYKMYVENVFHHYFGATTSNREADREDFLDQFHASISLSFVGVESSPMFSACASCQKLLEPPLD